MSCQILEKAPGDRQAIGLPLAHYILLAIALCQQFATWILSKTDLKKEQSHF